MEKINVILDTDTANQIDDQFAIAYLLKSKEKFNIEAITIAPFYKQDKCENLTDGQQKSYKEVLKIIELLNYEDKNIVHMGATEYFKDEMNQENDAVNKIIEIAHKNDKTYIIAIGAITNIALAIEKEASIVDKIEVVWLASNSLLYNNNNDFNFRQDIKANQKVFESNVKLNVIPVKNVASELKTTIYEIEHYLKRKGAVGEYLIELVKEERNGENLQFGKRKTIWDIAAVAYLINENWFEIMEISRPKISDNGEYILSKKYAKAKFVKYLDADKIFADLFEKI